MTDPSSFQGADLCHIFCEPSAATPIKVTAPFFANTMCTLIDALLFTPCSLILQVSSRQARKETLVRLMISRQTSLSTHICEHFSKSERKSKLQTLNSLFLHRNLEKNRSSKDVVGQISPVLSRLHVLVVGPGLSRDDVMQDTARELIQDARSKDMAIVVDAVSSDSVERERIDTDELYCLGWSFLGATSS